VRVVLDTNVLFAAFRANQGFCLEVFRQVVLKHELVTSAHILTELRRHLGGKGKIGDTKLAEIERMILSVSALVEPVEIPVGSCRDESDLPVLGTAVASKAQVLVTGDRDLLDLMRYGEFEILTPREFHDRFVTAGKR
jgi:putative PIN family toxin of toxin-antitoxin system